MTSLVCVECKLPICVSSDTNNQVACLDPCGHLCHSRCAKTLLGISLTAKYDNQNPPRATRTNAKCRDCQQSVNNMFIVYVGGNVLGSFESLDGTVDQHQHLRVTPELKQRLKAAEDSAMALREVAEEITKRKAALASDEHELHRAKDAMIALQSLTPGVTVVDSLKNKSLSDIRMLARDLAAKVEEHHKKRAQNGKNNNFVAPATLQGAILDNMTKSKEMEKDITRSTMKISAQRGELKQAKKEYQKLENEKNALIALLNNNNNNAGNGSEDGRNNNNNKNALLEQIFGRPSSTSNNNGKKNTNNNDDDDQLVIEDDAGNNNNNNMMMMMTSSRSNNNIRNNHDNDNDDDQQQQHIDLDADDLEEQLLLQQPPAVTSKSQKKKSNKKKNNDDDSVICLDSSSSEDDDEDDEEITMSQQPISVSSSAPPPPPASMLPARRDRNGNTGNNNNKSVVGGGVKMPKGAALPEKSRVQLEFQLQRNIL